MELQFWGAAGEVTGSCYLLEADNHRLLIDCGLIQGRPVDEARNRQPFPFDVDTLDAVVLSHAHLDHCGRLPLLVKAGYRGPIYAHPATSDLCRIMLQDAAEINEREAQWHNRQQHRRGLRLAQPLYTRADAEATLALFTPFPYESKRDILPGVALRLRDGGHILGSSIIELWLRQGETAKKLVFSGDLGHRGAPIMRDPSLIERADLVVMESTYGNRLHRNWQATCDELSAIMHQAREDGGNILIPSFAVGRTQDILYTLTQHYDAWQLAHWSVFLDSPLAIEATEIYSRHTDCYEQAAQAAWHDGAERFLLPGLHICRSAEESMVINEHHSAAIIIAGSGMCEGGRIRHHLRHNIWRNDCHVIIVGYQVEGTLGRALVDGARTIRLWDDVVEVNATIHTIGGFSAHADALGLRDWYHHIEGNPPLVLTHGEEEARATLADSLRNEQVAVYTPGYGEILDLDAI